MSDIPGTSFHLGDSVVGVPVTSLMGTIAWIPEPSGFDSICRARGPVGKWLKAKAGEVQVTARGLAPVDTGLLQSSIGVTYGKHEEGIYAEIGTDVYYAPFQEFGTVNHGPTPFLRPALAAVFGTLSMDPGGPDAWGADFEGTDGRFEWDSETRGWSPT